MRKIVICFLCASILILSASGCKQKQEVYRISSPVDELHWGMSEKAVINSLNLTEDMTRNENGLSVSIKTERKYKLYGATANLYMAFYDDLLTAIIAKISEEDLDTVEKTLTELLGEGEYIYYEPADSSAKIVTAIVWQDMILKDKPEYLDNIQKIYKDAGFDRLNERLGDRSLITYELILDKESAKYALLTIDGKLAALLNYPDKANKNIK